MKAASAASATLPRFERPGMQVTMATPLWKRNLSEVQKVLHVRDIHGQPSRYSATVPECTETAPIVTYVDEDSARVRSLDL